MQCFMQSQTLHSPASAFLGFTDLRTRGAELLSPPCGRDSSVNMLLTRNCDILLTARTWKRYKINFVSGSP